MKTGHLEMAISLLMENVYNDAKKGKVDIKTTDTLESLIRSWANLQTVSYANRVADHFREITDPEGPELPFSFPKPKKVEAV